jgi:hypothetical protein
MQGLCGGKGNELCARLGFCGSLRFYDVFCIVVLGFCVSLLENFGLCEYLIVLLEHLALLENLTFALFLNLNTNLLLLTLNLSLNLFLLQICRRRQLLALTIPPTDPNTTQLLVNLRLPALPLLDLSKPFTELCKFLLDARFLALGADTLELPLVAMVTRAESEGEGVVALEGRAG